MDCWPVLKLLARESRVQSSMFEHNKTFERSLLLVLVDPVLAKTVKDQ